MRKKNRISRTVLLVVLVLFATLFDFRPLNTVVARTYGIRIECPNKVVAGNVYNFTVSVTDSEGNVIDNSKAALGFAYGEVEGLRSFYKMSEADHGVHTFRVKFLRSGLSVVKVFDLRNPGVFKECKINVLPGVPYSLILNPRNVTVYPGEEYAFDVKLFDKNGNAINDLSDVKMYVNRISDSASGIYKGNGVFKFFGKGQCQVVAVCDNAEVSSNVYITNSKEDFLKVRLSLTNHGFRHISSYTVDIRNGKKFIPSGSAVSLYFPVNVVFPCPCHKKILNTDITVDGVNLNVNPTLKCNGYWHILTVKMPVSVKSFGRFCITLKESATIMNPMREKSFSVGVKADPYDYIYYSNYVSVGNLIDTPSVYAFPAITHGNPDFVFVFHTKSGFYMKKGDPIGLVLPYGSELPDLPPANNFSVNGYDLWYKTVITKWNKRTYVLPLPFDIGPNETVVIKISKTAGILLPPYEGSYQCGIIYNFNIPTVKSHPLYIRYKPLLNVNAKLPPHISRIPNLYNFNPTITLTYDSTYGYISTNIYYSVDHSKFKLYSGKFEIKGDGRHDVRYFAENTLGIKSETKSFSLSVDTKPPEIKFFEVVRAGKKFRIVFESDELLSSVYINGNYTVCGLNRKFYIFSESGSGKFEIVATDLAGNENREKIIVSGH